MRKKKGSYFQNKKSSFLQVPPKGSKGILITCDVSSVHRGIREAINMFEQFSDPLPEENQPAKPTEEQMSLEEAIEAPEKEEKKKTRFTQYISEVTGNCFIRFVYEQDKPDVIIRKYFDYLKEKGESLTKHVTRMYPIMWCGFPQADEALPVLKEMLPLMFKEKNPLQYEIVLQRKHKGDGQKETHDELNQKIMNLVGKPHHAVYHGGESAILW